MVNARARNDQPPFTTEAIIRQTAEHALERRLEGIEAHFKERKDKALKSERQQLEKELAQCRDDHERRKKVVANWTKTQLETAKKNGWLMSEQQYRDFSRGRRFQIGDEARFIGEARYETVGGPSSRTVKRKHGQLGRITKVLDDGMSGRVITFTPYAADIVSDHRVQYVVREFSPAFLELERVPRIANEEPK